MSSRLTYREIEMRDGEVVRVRETRMELEDRPIRLGDLPDTGDVVRLGMREAFERPEWLDRL